MLEGRLSGRITSIAGDSGVTSCFRLIVALNYGNQDSAPILDVVNVMAAAYFSYSKEGFVQSPVQHEGIPIRIGDGSYIGPAYLHCNGPLGMVTSGAGPLWTFRVNADHALLNRIERDRKGRDVVLRLEITVVSVARPREDGRTSVSTPVATGQVHDWNSPGSAHCSIEIPKSKWLELLKSVGYGEFYMAEIPLPSIKKAKALDASLQHLQRAWEHFLNGADKETLAACFDALEKLTKESLNPQSTPGQNAFAKILSPLASGEKIKKLSEVLSHCASLLQLGRHEQVPPIQLDHRDAELGLLLTHACIAYLSRQELMIRPSANKRTSAESS